MPTSIRDVALAARVSVSTVSNVLNAPEKVALPTRQRVLETISELGFSRNESARQLRAGRSRTLGLMVPDIRNPFFTEVARGLERTARSAGLVVLLCDTDLSEETEDGYLDMLREQRVYGLVVTPVNGVRPPLRKLRDAGTRIVLLVDRAPGFCSVTVEDVGGAHRAVDHLLAMGHRHIVVVSSDTARQALRRKGAGDAAASYPDATLTHLRVPRLDIPSGERAAQQLAAMDDRPTAVFCGNDRLAFGILHGLAGSGVAVPGEMSVVGYDDVEFAAAASVPLTTVRQPSVALGSKAVELLAEEDDDTHEHQTVTYGTELVIRNSTAPLTPARVPEATSHWADLARRGRSAAADRPDETRTTQRARQEIDTQ